MRTSDGKKRVGTEIIPSSKWKGRGLLRLHLCNYALMQVISSRPHSLSLPCLGLEKGETTQG